MNYGSRTINFAIEKNEHISNCPYCESSFAAAASMSLSVADEKCPKCREETEYAAVSQLRHTETRSA